MAPETTIWGGGSGVCERSTRPPCMGPTAADSSPFLMIDSIRAVASRMSGHAEALQTLVAVYAYNLKRAIYVLGERKLMALMG